MGWSSSTEECVPLLKKPQEDHVHKETHAHIHNFGLICITGLIVSWVLQAEASQALQSKANFNKPWFLVCFNHGVTGLLLPILFLYFKSCSRSSSSEKDKPTRFFDWYDTFQEHSVLPMQDVLKISAFLGAFYACADYLWYCALAQVSVTVASTIFNCSPLFVYMFSVCLLNESVTPLKIFGVLTSLAGVTLIVFYQNNNSIDLASAKHVNSANIISGIIVVVSAALYAAYEVLFKFLIGKDTSDRSTVMILTGFTGLLTVPVWFVGAFFLHFIKLPALHESIALPQTLEAIGYLCSSGLMALVFNVFLPLSISLTSPLETSVGCMLTIPLSGILDTWWHNAKFSVECIIGSILVMLGFGILEGIATRFAKEEDELEQHQHKKDHVLA